MALGDLVDSVVGAPRSIRVYSPDPVPALEDHFAATNVTVEHVPLPAAADSAFLTVHEGDEFLGGTSLAAVGALLEPSVAAPWDEGRRETRMDDLLDLLAGVSFVGFDRSQMLAVSREIEDRAWRLGDGELHATFSKAKAVAGQRAVYRRLATRDALSVNVYVASGAAIEPLPGVTIHEIEPTALDDVWAVAYLGGDPVNATALVGQESNVAAGLEGNAGRTAGGFAGCWTDDPAKVETVVETITDLAT
ncbi:DICT sensory domain-containing protein [Halobacteriales archaeon Cl-PHB]